MKRASLPGPTGTRRPYAPFSSAGEPAEQPHRTTQIILLYSCTAPSHNNASQIPVLSSLRDRLILSILFSPTMSVANGTYGSAPHGRLGAALLPPPPARGCGVA